MTAVVSPIRWDASEQQSGWVWDSRCGVYRISWRGIWPADLFRLRRAGPARTMISSFHQTLTAAKAAAAKHARIQT